MEYKNLASNIRNTRKTQGLTQKELGQRICKSEISIRKYESGNVNIPPSTLFDICDALNIGLKEILGNDFNQYANDNFNEAYNILNDRLNKEISKFDKTSNLLSKQKSILDYETNSIDENGIKELIDSTIVNIMFLACENDKLGYNIDSFTESEIEEIATFVYNSYKLKINEILERHKEKNTQNNDQISEYTLAAHDDNLDPETKKKNLEKAKEMFKEMDKEDK
ncbi:putative DNA-binding protein [Clostridium neonatale]|uniref:helix-turn-helix domain-containing protein n=1 Tax=Clostridium neonatale TaxID=137838 RepID=UPI00291C1EEE|nr:helix-turn-helix transcriptional regulator [Clostridium neonatale]CAI3604969.1 putative DNA-binding protein [Clostridium neonatale]